MTSRDYIAIAKIFAGDYATCTTDGERRKVVGLALSLSDYFKRDNSRFDRVKFLKACGLTNAPQVEAVKAAVRPNWIYDRNDPRKV